MAKGYVVVNVHVNDTEHYPEYARQAFDTVTKFDSGMTLTGL